MDIFTDEQFVLTTVEMETAAQFTRQKVEVTAKSASGSDKLTAPSVKLQNFISQNTQNTPSNSAPQSPPLDERKWISPTAGAKYIDNSAYFMTAGQTPMHGRNTAGTCTAVATQLMLSYNNFYNDRRIIAPQHLHGGWNAGGNGDIFDPDNYTTRDWNPNVSTNYESMTSRTLGSNQAYHDLLVNNGITGYLHDAEGKLRAHLNGRLGANSFVVDCQENTTLPFGLGNWKTIASTNILAEINANRPVVIATGSSINGTGSNPNVRNFDHAVVAYGYQTFAAYAGSGNSNEYLGYIVNMGWENNGGMGTTTNIWTNSSWYYGYLKLEVNNHTHNYSIDTGVNHDENSTREVRCGECGHRMTESLFNVSDGILTSPRYNLTGAITIPSTINGQSVSAIGNSAFANQTKITQITIPSSVSTIGDKTFSGCTNLSKVNISLEHSSLKEIGDEAFKGCENLTAITIPNRVKTIGKEAFLDCYSLANVNIHASNSDLRSIGEKAFSGCETLVSITIQEVLASEHSNIVII